MKKNNLAIALVVGTLLIGSAVLKFKNKQTSSPKVKNRKESILSLFKKGISMECQMKDKETGVVTIIYSKNGKTRIEGTTPIKGQETSTKKSFVISDGEFVYTWEKGKKQGVKLKAYDEKESKKVEPNTENIQKKTKSKSAKQMVKEWENNSKTEYNCKKISLDDGLFVPPRDISFLDIEAMQKNIQDGIKNGDFDKQMEKLKESLGK